MLFLNLHVPFTFNGMYTDVQDTPPTTTTTTITDADFELHAATIWVVMSNHWSCQ